MSGWIKVKEKKPSSKTLVLMLSKHRVIFMGYLIYDTLSRKRIWKLSFANHRFELSRITHWLPLPPLPVVDEEEG